MRSWRSTFFLCIVLLLCVAGKYSFAACPSPAKISGYSYTPTSIQDAYAYASNTLGLATFTLQLPGEILTEDLLLDGGAVVFDGGYDCSFTTKTTTPTGLFGTLTIGSGSVVFAGNVTIVSTSDCAFDADGDGYTSIGSCSGTANDCNDNDPTINPGATESCDGIDNNCDGQIDEGAIPVDNDGDGYYAIGSCGDSQYTDDCNDVDANINPGALEIPLDGIDQDCNGSDLTFAGETCTFCHSSSSPGLFGGPVFWADNHAAITAPAATPPLPACATCHNAEVSNVLSGHYGQTVQTAGNGLAAGSIIVCQSCHDQVDNIHNFGSNILWSKVKAAQPNVTCDTCHETRAAVHNDTSLAHNNRAIDSRCGVCHTSDTTATGIPGIGSLTSQSDVDQLHRSDCALCHDYRGTTLNAAVVREVVAQGVSGATVSCLDCHTDKGSGHIERDHTIAEGPADLSNDAPGQPCSDCHQVSNWVEIESITHNVPTNGAGSCATCHNSPDLDVRNAITTGANPTRCLTCHTDKGIDAVPFHGNAEHGTLGYVTGGSTYCLNCHDTGTPENGAVLITHKSICSHCHTRLPDLKPGLPVGGGVCTDCHTNSWELTHISNPPSHISLVQVGTTGCGDCHDDTLYSAENRTHDSCSSCHDALGATISRADGKTLAAGGDCVTCHSENWDTIHLVAPTHAMIVTVSGTTCANCHDNTLTSPAANTHDACTSCHDVFDGTLINLATGQSAPGNCSTCHTNTWENTHPNAPDHSALVKVTGSSCALCHDNTLTSSANNTHNGCSSCHSSTDGSLVSHATGKTFSVDGDCTTCHLDSWATTHTVAPDHSGIVTVGTTSCSNCHDDGVLVGARSHFACTSCHDATTGALISFAIGKTFVPGGDCTSCHTFTWRTTHITNTPSHTSLVTVSGTGTTGTSCASCHDDTLYSAALNTHNDCNSCHDASGALIGIAIGKDFMAGGNCMTCHTTGFDAIHAARTHTVTQGTGDLSYESPGTLCENCHVVANWSEIEGIEHNVATNGAGPCATCHNSPRQDVINAISQGANPTNCLDCHQDKFLTVHGTVDHTSLNYVTGGSVPCLNCHETGDPSNGTVSVTHMNKCFLCHTTVPDLKTGLPVNGGNCVDCHITAPDPNGTWESIHFNNPPSHNSLVQVAATTCGNCHDNSLIANAGMPGADTHLGCNSCHDTDGDLQGIAIGKDFSTGGDCTTCHGAGWSTIHSPGNEPDHSNLITVTGTGCGSCHDNTLLADAVLPGVDTHLDCASCHNPTSGSLISFAIGKTFTAGGNCATCHMDTWENTHTPEPDHSDIVTVSGTGCAQCHNDTLISAGNKTHDTCSNCHDADGALISLAAGKSAPGDCTTCHTGTWESTHTNAPDHSALVTVSGTSCDNCHSSPPPLIDPTDPLNHDACSDCHNAITGALVSYAMGKTFSAGGNCSTCHMNADSSHHMTNFAQTGDCFHCHTSLAVDRPAQAACRECHGTVHNDKGGHPQNYAACAACHDTTPYHAKPPQAIGYNRTTYNGKQTGKGRFAIFWSQWTNNGQDQEGTYLENISPNGEDMNDEGGRDWSNPSLNFEMYQINKNGQNYMVPGFSPPEQSGGGTSSNDNLALNETASASGYYGSSYQPSRSVDGNNSSYWYERSWRSEWLKVDLGQSKTISKVIIKWHNSEYAEEYQVQTSTNNYNWTTVRNENNGNGGTDTITFSSRSARYVRVYCERERNNGYGIYELEVYQQ